MTFQELETILMEEKPSNVLLDRKEELASIIPEFSKTYDFDQKTIWHTKDVFRHTLMVVDGVSNDLRVRLSALFHDIGKPEVMTLDEEGNGHFYGHWEKSEEIFQKYQDKFSLEEEDIYLVRNLIYYHDLTLNLKSFPVFQREFSREDMKYLFDLKKADSMAHNEIFLEDRLKKLKEAEKLYYSFCFDEQKTWSSPSFSIIKEQRDRLLVYFVNSLEKGDVIKSRRGETLEEDFLVGIYLNDEFYTYTLPGKYFDEVEAPFMEWEDVYWLCNEDGSYKDFDYLVYKKEKDLDAKRLF